MQKDTWTFRNSYVLLGGNKLQSTGNKTEDLKGAECVKSTPVTSVQIPEVKPDTVSDPVTPASLAALQSDVQPVGHDYVEEVLIGDYAVRWDKKAYHLDRKSVV